MSSVEVMPTIRRPNPPKDDFIFCIDFKKGVGPASRVFSATHEFIKACERLDQELVTAVDGNIEAIMVLEDVETGSLKTHLRNVLKTIDDQALKMIDWKPAVGKYLVKAKYLILRWTEEGNAPEGISELSREIQELASETDVLHIPAYTPINSRTLINAAEDFDRVKDHLIEGDEASMTVSDNEIMHFNLSRRFDAEGIESLTVRETLIHSVPSMVLIVKKPDYLGNSMWGFRHGGKSIPAVIEKEEWLSDFQHRRIDVRPGDALKCRVRIETMYGHDNELLAEKYYVEDILEVLENQYRQDTMTFK